MTSTQKEFEGRVPKDVREGVEGDLAVTARSTWKAPGRFWVELVVAFTTGFLYIATPFRPDWIEAICGFDPDQHDGSLEWMIVMALLVVTLAMLGALGSRTAGR
jgi:hypothetical protein